MIVAQIIAFLFVGILAGCIAGLVGIGGGLLYVPFQLFIYYITGFPADDQMKVALGTSLAAVVFTTLSASRAHAKRDSIYWEVIYKMAIGVIFGAIFGAIAARWLPNKVLELIYGIIECLAGLYFLFMRSLHSQVPSSLPNFFLMSIIGFFIGGISSLLGMGGGFISLPIMVALHIPLRKAIGSSAAIAFLISSVGSVAYTYPALEGLFSPYSLGYVYLPAFVPLTVGAVFAVPWGAKLAHEISKEHLKKGLAIALIILGIFVIIR